jgi:leader peptidase (prepilin peptidase)/N-methyltransferase
MELIADNFVLTQLDWLLLLAAPFIGSFLGVLIRRLPQDAPVLWGRSECPHCHARLGPLELVPLLSFLRQRGTCRHCGGPIAPFHWHIELAALAVAVWAVLASPPDGALANCILGWSLLALAWIDAETMLLPDALTLPLLIAGLAEAWLADPDNLLDRAVAALLGWGSLAALGFAWRRLRGIDALGEGDAKLLAAAGAWLGWMALPWVLVIAACGGIIAALAQGGWRVRATYKLAFGPWLALATWLMRLYGG